MAYEESVSDKDFYGKAILSLLPDAAADVEWGPNGNNAECKIVTWYDERPQPTEAAILAEAKVVEAAYNKLKYSRERSWEYDQLNQHELIGDDSINGTTTHKDAITAIKVKWPKDNSGPIE